MLINEKRPYFCREQHWIKIYMLTTTKAIFLHTTRLSGNKVVIHLYTKDFGRVSIVANNLHRKNSDLKMSLLTPFSLFNLTFNFQEKKDLHRYEELVPYYIFQQIPFSPIRSALSLFMTEIVYRSIKERQTDESLFSFFAPWCRIAWERMNAVIMKVGCGAVFRVSNKNLISIV